MPLAPHTVHSSTEPPDKLNLESAYDREMQRTETEILKILESSQTLMRVLERKERRFDTTRWEPRKNPAAKIPPARRRDRLRRLAMRRVTCPHLRACSRPR